MPSCKGKKKRRKKNQIILVSRAIHQFREDMNTDLDSEFRRRQKSQDKVVHHSKSWCRVQRRELDNRRQHVREWIFQAPNIPSRMDWENQLAPLARDFRARQDVDLAHLRVDFLMPSPSLHASFSHFDLRVQQLKIIEIFFYNTFFQWLRLQFKLQLNWMTGRSEEVKMN